jgi:hypothetical protein
MFTALCQSSEPRPSQLAPVRECSRLPGSTTRQTVFVKIVLLGNLSEPTTSFAPFEMAESVLNVFESGGTGNPSVLELEWHLIAFIEMVSFNGHNLVLPERGFRAIQIYISSWNGDDDGLFLFFLCFVFSKLLFPRIDNLALDEHRNVSK